jgi:hypothetical protein
MVSVAMAKPPVPMRYHDISTGTAILTWLACLTSPADLHGNGIWKIPKSVNVSGVR